ncbi:MAG: 3-hydroxybutyryl-CoA dehydrogenase [Deltaproteobacteria bacterium]|nr:MAG: 3-hydroxybutyryl-CoA dehydrogenase [Deltaproteobacteria bacterium]
MEIKTIGVIGAGQMGHGIAQVAASKGFSVILHDIDLSLVEKGKEKIAAILARLVAKERITEGEKREIEGRIRGVTALSDMVDADFVVEAATENAGIKLDIFRTLDEVCRPGVILASNTSSISITRLAAATKRPERVIGMHFMNPVPVMKLVEVVTGLPTSEETRSTVEDLARRLGKEPRHAKDFPGFVINRILMPMINEAIFALQEGVGSAQDIDDIMRMGANHPMGPLALADLIGLDTCLAILEVLHEGFGDPKFRPCPLLRNYVAAGWLGRKTGRGFFTYTS